MTEEIPCLNCNGSGQVDEIVQTNDGPQPTPVQCSSCGGSGRVRQ
jgi:DnaJ-class molecular chaperone